MIDSESSAAGPQPMDKPKTADQFLSQFGNLVRSVFPDLMKPSHVQGEKIEVNPEEIVTGLEDRIWEINRNDLMYNQIGRERYNALPPEQRFKVLKNELKYMHAARKLENRLHKGS